VTRPRARPRSPGCRRDLARAGDWEGCETLGVDSGLIRSWSNREDAHILYGFYSKTEREIFKLLLSVSGVGPSTAVTMLSSMDTDEIQEAIAHEDVIKIQSVKGIGLKTAQRVIVDLRDKILKSYEISEELQTPNNTIRNEALSALEVLGFNKKKVEKTIQVILQEEPDTSLEDLIKKALKNL